MNDHELITTMRESFTDVQSATPVEQIVSRSHAIRARRRIPGAVAVVAVAAAVGTTVALIPSGSAKPAPTAAPRVAPPAARAAAPPAMHTTAYVVGHVTRALDAMPDNTVVVMQQTSVPASHLVEQVSTMKVGRLEAFTPAGQPSWDSGHSFSGSGTQETVTRTFVNYQNKTWWRSVSPFPNATSPATVWTCSNVGTDTIIGNPAEMAGQLRTAVSCGELKVVGNSTVDGIPAIQLSGNVGGSGAVTYWLNATTYLPFRFTSSNSQLNLQWLPPTAANLAQANVSIPAGFKQVPPVPSDPW